MDGKYVTLLWETDVVLGPHELPTETLKFSFPGKFIGGEFNGKPIELSFLSCAEPVTPEQLFSLAEPWVLLDVAHPMLMGILRAARFGKFRLELYVEDLRPLIETTYFKLEKITLISNERSTDYQGRDPMEDAN